MNALRFLFVLGAVVSVGTCVAAPSAPAANAGKPAANPPQAPAVLPGKGLAQHDFFYAGEAKEERLSIVRGGQVVWSYTHSGRGEISDAVLEPNGNILFAHQFGVTEITLDKKVVWALRSWSPPADLGPSTTIQILDDVYAPAVLPGRGLAQHPFLYTGEWDHRNKVQTLYVVRDGKVAWTYSIPINDEQGVMQELGDATMLSNGNIVFCRKAGASEITPGKKIVWDIVAPTNAEIHSVQPIGLDHLLVMQNGNPAKLMLINTTTGRTEKQLTLPVPKPDKPHLQFRRVRQTRDGTFLAAHLDDNKVVEYDADGKAIWTSSYSTNPASRRMVTCKGKPVTQH
jgi:outer membrane protein assembly factor BamB